MSRLVAVLLGVAAGVAFAVTAHVAWAHPVADFYAHKWATPTVTYGYTPSVPTGEWRTSIDASAATWGNVNGANFGYVHGTDYTSDYDPTVCNTNGQNGIHRAPQGDGAGGVLGVTFMCWSGSGTQPFISMQVRFDSAENFYTGSATTIPNQPDLRSVATHELGHGTGFGVGAPNSHFDGNDSTLCALNATEQTMCPTHLSGSTWQRTLEVHDQHTFAGEYPGVVTTTTSSRATSTTVARTSTTRPSTTTTTRVRPSTTTTSRPPRSTTTTRPRQTSTTRVRPTTTTR